MEPVVLGLVAGALTSTAFVPQIVRGFRTRRLTDVSPLMLAVMSLGLALWLAYGVIRRDPAIVAANVVGLSLTLALLAMWARWGRPPPTAP